MEKYAVIVDNGGGEQQYRDVVGSVYTINKTKRNIIPEGTKVIYYRSSKASHKVQITDGQGLMDEAHYFGTATIGHVTQSATNEDRLEVEILDYERFHYGVPTARKDGTKYEDLRGWNGINGVRAIDEETYNEIVTASTIPHSNARTMSDKSKNKTHQVLVKDLRVISSGKNFYNNRLRVVISNEGYYLHDIVADVYRYIGPKEAFDPGLSNIKNMQNVANREKLDKWNIVNRYPMVPPVNICIIEIIDNTVKCIPSCLGEKQFSFPL